jgi:uncharacterized protein (DUF1501 family)
MPASSKTGSSRRSVSRRDFLAVGGLSMVGLSVAERAAVLRAQERSGPRSVVLVVMNGGPSHLETFDPKPDAPSTVRGPLKAIATSIPGVHFSESLPRLAERAGRFAVVRTLFHDAAPLHEAGHQVLYSGVLPSKGVAAPSLGSAVSRLLGARGDAPAYVMLPGPVSASGVSVPCGGGPGWLGDKFQPALVDADPRAGEPGADSAAASLVAPFDAQPVAVREEYGETPFGCRLWQSARLIEAGVRVVTVNLCPKLAGQVTWDAHAHKTAAPATLFDYRDTIGPQFDRACSALLDDLHSRGLLRDTLVIATGEFGRTPYLNAAGGRDHWPHCWSALLAGAGVPGGTVIGASDATGEYPLERPVPLPQLVATAYQALRVDARVSVAVNGTERVLLDVDPISDLAA